MKLADYYARYRHFLQIDLNQVESFKQIKIWVRGKKQILDVGCGVGYLTEYWRAQGIDKAAEAVRQAQQYFPERRFTRLDITKTMPFKQRYFDTVICYNVLEHLPDAGRERFFREAKRLLKPDGMFIAGYIDREYWFNRLSAQIFPDYGINDPTHLSNWTIPEFKAIIGVHFRLIKSKRTSPYGRLIPLTRFFKGELLILAKP